MTNLIHELANAAKRDDVPAFRAGDTIKVHVKVVEGNRARVQVFQGVVLRVQGSGIGRTFTVRKVSFGVGVERTFPINSPIFESIEIVGQTASPWSMPYERGLDVSIGRRPKVDLRQVWPELRHYI